MEGPLGDGPERLAGLLRELGPAVVLTGAGISVPSGITDFRTPASEAVASPSESGGQVSSPRRRDSGTWADVDPMTVATIDVWRHDPERFWSFYLRRFAMLDGKQPNDAHRAVAELQRRGLVSTVVTQNIDGLHHAAGSEDVIELHGSVRSSSCLRDGFELPLAETRVRGQQADDGVPRCDCGAPLKPDVVLFGELLPEAAMDRAHALCTQARLVVAIGSSLSVYPAAGLPGEALRAGATLAIVTQSDTDFDRWAAVRLRGDVADELAAVLAALGRPA